MTTLNEAYAVARAAVETSLAAAIAALPADPADGSRPFRAYAASRLATFRVTGRVHDAVMAFTYVAMGEGQGMGQANKTAWEALRRCVSAACPEVAMAYSATA